MNGNDICRLVNGSHVCCKIGNVNKLFFNTFYYRKYVNLKFKEINTYIHLSSDKKKLKYFIEI